MCVLFALLDIGKIGKFDLFYFPEKAQKLQMAINLLWLALMIMAVLASFHLIPDGLLNPVGVFALLTSSLLSIFFRVKRALSSVPKR
jgi:hypothetical protein